MPNKSKGRNGSGLDVRNGLSNNQRKTQARFLRDLLQICDTIKEKSFTSPGRTNRITFEEFESIYDSVELLRQMEAKNALPCDIPTNRGDISEFVSWCRLSGIKIHPDIELHDFGFPIGFGLRAVQDITSGTKLFEIPVDVMIGLDIAEEGIVAEVMQGDMLWSGMETVKLALFLLEEKWSPNSKWGPYISALPKAYTCSLEMDLEGYKLLRGTSAFEEAMKLFRNIARQYAYLKRLFHSDEKFNKLNFVSHFSFDEYRWVVCTLTTRQNSVPVPRRKCGKFHIREGSLMMIPLYDFANHDDKGAVGDFDEGVCSSVCNGEIKAGEQIFICYGSRGNWQTLVHNGYIMGCDVFGGVLEGRFDPVHDKFPITIEFVEADASLKEVKTRILQHLLGGLPSKLSILASPPHLTPDFLAFARLSVASEEFLSSIRESELWLFNCDVADGDPKWAKLCRQAVTWTCVKISKALKSFTVPKETLVEKLKLLDAEFATKSTEALKRKAYLHKMSISLAVTEMSILEVVRPWLMGEIKRLGASVDGAGGNGAEK